MESLFVFRGMLQETYAKNSKVIDKVIQFVLALVTFYLINHNVGFMKMAASPVVMLALAVISAFFPMIVTVLMATALILTHMYAVSLGAFAVTALIFLIMYIFYFRLTSKMALVVLLTPLAFALKIPCVIPIVYGLIAAPTALVAISCGIITYYMMEYVKKAAAGMNGKDAVGLMGQVTAYLKQVFQSKEMWIVILACIISFLVVYTVRRQSVNHAWKIAVVAGALTDIIVLTVGDISFGVKASYFSMILAAAVAVALGLVLEFFFFSVDYSRSEKLQFEDDEYYYYVKAVPKLSVAIPEKTVKRINKRQDSEEVRGEETRRKSRGEDRPAAKKNMRSTVTKTSRPKKGPAAKKHDIREVDKMLLTQSLKKDLNLK